MHWLLHASRLSRPRLDVLYTLDGRPGPPEQELPAEVAGYRDSRPVRVGNGASEQHQLDVYGWVLEAAARLAGAQHDMHAATIRAMAGFADHVAERWSEPDSGIWEVRGDPAHYVHSKVMAWVTLDRAVELHRGRRLRRSRREAWTAAKDALAREIPSRGFNDELKSYVRTYGGTDLDASFLTLPGLGFDADRRERLSGTVRNIRERLGAGGPLLFRYAPDTDGLEGTEGAFAPCSFWLVDALAALDRPDEAREIFEQACAMSTSLQLFAEEIDPSTREHIGNYPQALTHSALVQAAVSLDASLRRAGARERR
jgi:GH15 family glucan-1,4-alpha-glucosidase